LTGQVDEKIDMGNKGKVIDEQQQKEHHQNWETFWGRPGYGAPRDSAQKENLMKMLHYPENTTKNVGINFNRFFNNFSLFLQAPNNVELITLERLPVK
jgi:hypothetical protein